MMEHKDQVSVASLYKRAFGRRPEEELYDLSKAPGQLKNIAMKPKYESIRKTMADKLIQRLKTTKDPRIGSEAIAGYEII